MRDRNEDSALVDPSGHFFLVADGMGGHLAGDVASAMAIDVVRQRLEGVRSQIVALAMSPSEERRKRLEMQIGSAVREAHDAVYQRAQNEPDKYGMGTTLDVVVIAGTDAFVAHVGDSRTYLIRDGRAILLTRDHTFAQLAVAAGSLSSEQAASSSMSSVLINAIGVTPDVTVDLAHHELRAGDRLLLCSDGLYDYFKPEELAGILSSSAAGSALDELVALSRSRGGHDNITGIVVEVLAGRARADTWDDETTIPRAMADGTPRPILHTPSAGTKPLAAVSEDSLLALVEVSIREESGPVGAR